MERCWIYDLLASRSVALFWNILAREYLIEVNICHVHIWVLFLVLIIKKSKNSFFVFEKFEDIVDVSVEKFGINRFAGDRVFLLSLQNLALVENHIETVVFAENLTLLENKFLDFFSVLPTALSSIFFAFMFFLSSVDILGMANF